MFESQAPGDAISSMREVKITEKKFELIHSIHQQYGNHNQGLKIKMQESDEAVPIGSYHDIIHSYKKKN